MAKRIALVAGVLILAWINFTIWSHEQVVRHGETIFLELAPVDPRSPMQGDYMALAFKAVREAERAGLGDGDRAILQLDEQGIGRFHRPDTGGDLDAGERRLQLHLRGDRLGPGTNAFFFQEGHAGLYAGARYGELRLDADGKAYLVALRDEELRLLGPEESAEQ
ncbi:MAG: GDYXXLXY domain-containing protein [Acidobacteriota bacterium]|nr:GDYXXLXY domain-containing protein [Acidobacteriota bacterium]